MNDDPARCKMRFLQPAADTNNAGTQLMQIMSRTDAAAPRMRVPRARGGFTLIELAVALLIVTVLLGAILVPLTTQVVQRKISDTEKALEDAKEALLGFAVANGRLPCPASATSNGVESFAAGGSAADGNCSNFFDGFLPAVTLGLTPVNAEGYAVDGWGGTQNRIRYAVSNETVATVTNPFTKINGMRSATIASIAAASLLLVCGSGAGPPTTGPPPGCGGTVVKLTDKAPVVVWSTGANAATTGGASVDEAQNPNPNGGSADRFFVYRATSNVAGSEFDDIVTWIAVGTLASRMVAAGQLP